MLYLQCLECDERHYSTGTYAYCCPSCNSVLVTVTDEQPDPVSRALENIGKIVDELQKRLILPE